MIEKICKLKTPFQLTFLFIERSIQLLIKFFLLCSRILEIILYMRTFFLKRQQC